MKENRSPWLYQLRKDRPTTPLSEDRETDVAVIGAGIAGIATSFFILKNTEKSVTLLEASKLAHGATGHNAGQITSYFERGFASIVEEFGLEMAGRGQKGIEDAWKLVDEMYTDANLTIPLSRFLGHAGLCSFEQVEAHLKNNVCRKKAGLNIERMIVAEDADFLGALSAEYEGLYSTLPRKDILAILETETPDFVAVLSYQKGCMNSALFCEEIVLYLQKKYGDRFALCEHTPIEKMVLKSDHAILDAGKHTVTAGRVVLCTNGFESIRIFNETGLDIDAKFHHHIHGTVGYMSGYLEHMNKQPIAISYFTEPSADASVPYFYLTRRPYEYENITDHNLISIGGPEASLEKSITYSRDDGYPDEMSEQIDAFVRKIYDVDPNKKIDYIFTWHGLMGYTKNGIRMVGPEPQNSVLLYNLGCNGVGILPSLFGGKQIACHIAGMALEKTIFDVPPQA